jgi:hypothetical protein
MVKMRLCMVCLDLTLPLPVDSEFCNMVHKIFIYTREEIERMNPGALNSMSKNSLSNSLARGVASKELHGGPPTSSLNSEKC